MMPLPVAVTTSGARELITRASDESTRHATSAFHTADATLTTFPMMPRSGAGSLGASLVDGTLLDVKRRSAQEFAGNNTLGRPMPQSPLINTQSVSSTGLEEPVAPG